MCAGPVSFRPPIVSSTTWAFSRALVKVRQVLARHLDQAAAGESMPSSRASLGLTRIALSQLIFVIGSGHSWSQPLLLKRPSSIRASATKRTSIASLETAGSAGTASRSLFGSVIPERTRIALKAVPSRNPSCRNLRNRASAAAGEPACAVIVSKTSV